MRRRLAVVVLGAIVVLSTAVAVGCTSDGDGEGPAVVDRPVGPDTDEDDGPVVTEPGPVDLRVGERVTIRLRSNLSTGFQWAPVSGPDAAVAKVVSGNYRPSESGRAGAAGTQDVVLEGVAPGTTTLELGYARPWEQGTPPARTADFEITVS